MCTFIRPGGRASQKRQRHDGRQQKQNYDHGRYCSGFTLPEVLVSLLICMLLLQIVGQWSVLTTESNRRIQQNQQAVLLAQSVLAGSQPVIPDGWEIVVDKKSLNSAAIHEILLWEWTIDVKHEEQRWQFYYAGEG